jgi:excisionase family DNA binding protein
MILTLKELADYLRVNERTVLRMLKTGQIQGAKIGGQWRFNGSQIDSLFFPNTPPDADAVPLATLTRTHIGIPVSRVMSADRMVPDMRADTVESAIEELTAHSLWNAVLMDVSELRQKCIAREGLLSTGVGHGVAIPHPRDPLPTLRAPAAIAFGRSRNGINFNAADGKPVHVFFLLCCQNIEVHLHILGRLANLLQRDGFIQACSQCETPEDVLRVIMEGERADFFKNSGS